MAAKSLNEKICAEGDANESNELGRAVELRYSGVARLIKKRLMHAGVAPTPGYCQKRVGAEGWPKHSVRGLKYDNEERVRWREVEQWYATTGVRPVLVRENSARDREQMRNRRWNGWP